MRLHMQASTVLALASAGVNAGGASFYGLGDLIAAGLRTRQTASRLDLV